MWLKELNQFFKLIQRMEPIFQNLTQRIERFSYMQLKKNTTQRTKPFCQYDSKSLNTTQRIEPLFFWIRLKESNPFYWMWLKNWTFFFEKYSKTLNFSFFDKTQKWTFFFKYDSKNWTSFCNLNVTQSIQPYFSLLDSKIFWICLKRIKLFLVLLDFSPKKNSMNWTFLNMTHRIEPSLSMTLRIEPFFVWLKELNLSSFPIWLNPLKKWLKELNLFFLNDFFTWLKEPFFHLTQRFFNGDSKELNFSLFEYDSKN